MTTNPFTPTPELDPAPESYTITHVDTSPGGGRRMKVAAGIAVAVIAIGIGILVALLWTQEPATPPAAAAKPAPAPSTTAEPVERSLCSDFANNFGAVRVASADEFTAAQSMLASTYPDEVGFNAALLNGGAGTVVNVDATLLPPGTPAPEFTVLLRNADIESDRLGYVITGAEGLIVEIGFCYTETN